MQEGVQSFARSAKSDEVPIIMVHDFRQTDATLCQQRRRQLSKIHHFVIDRSRSRWIDILR